MKRRHYRKQAEEAIESSGKEPQEPEKVIEELREISSPKQQCATLFGASLTAAALVLASMSFLSASQERDELFLMMAPILKDVCIFFLSSSLLFMFSFGLSYVYEIVQGGGSQEAKTVVQTGLAFIIGFACALLFIGVFQLIIVLRMSWRA